MKGRLRAFFKTVASRYPAVVSTLKKIYLRFQPYDGPTLFPTRGPTRCELAANIAIASGGNQTVVLREDEYHFEIPPTDNPSIAKLFAAHSHTKYPPVSISVIPGGHVYANGAVFSPDGTAIARDLSLDFTSPFEAHYLCGQLIHRSQSIKGRTLSVVAWRTYSYYHWLLDELPRYLLPDLHDFDQIVCSRDSAINREAIHLLGLENETILFLNKGKHYQCDTLIVPSYVATTGEPSPYLVERLAQAVQPLLLPDRHYPEKIFISRKSAGVRQITNEDAVFNLLELQGYTRVKLEDFSWQDQINLFITPVRSLRPMVLDWQTSFSALKSPSSLRCLIQTTFTGAFGR
jgi:hypothetical protein